jgi:hypothetical protein
MVPAPRMAAILKETEELIKIFFSSVRNGRKEREVTLRILALGVER